MRQFPLITLVELNRRESNLDSWHSNKTLFVVPTLVEVPMTRYTVVCANFNGEELEFCRVSDTLKETPTSSSTSAGVQPFLL